MSGESKDFYGKEVAEAIKKACDELGVSQEKLNIEVVETGSTGIFGLIRKKAHIRVTIKPELDEVDDIFAMGQLLSKPADTKQAEVEEIDEEAEPEQNEEDAGDDGDSDDSDDDDEEEAEGSVDGTVSDESVALIRRELTEIVDLMGFPSELEVTSQGIAVTCTLRGQYEENLIGQDGKVLDSLQYLLRKIVSRKLTERVRLAVNVGDFRQRRLEELKQRAVALATQVKEDGKTQVLPALNPSERREIHMVLQEDKEIRSRSVGDGLFKKILIYKPGKSNRSSGRRRSSGKGKGRGSANKQDRDE
jgi:spoIIIJ-associated protein